ncbi:MAG: molybdate ABC transporter substrate-binding protein [Acidimicrobiia bacterium]
MGRPRRFPASALLAVAATALAACGGGDSPAGTSGDGLRGNLIVLAAASLTEAFDEIGERFEAAHPGVEVTFSYDASSALAQQVLSGAPADVLATADEVTMHQAVGGSVVDPPAVFARNRLAVVVGAGNPEGIRSLADLARPGLVVVLCAEQVPCGRFSNQVLERAGVRAQPRSFEANVKGVVSKVVLGEADAGIAYLTDARAAGRRVEAVPIPDAQNVVAAYPVAVVSSAPNRAAATAFVAYVRSPDGQSALESFGFEPA